MGVDTMILPGIAVKVKNIGDTYYGFQGQVQRGECEGDGAADQGAGE